MKKWFCRCGKTLESEERPPEEDEIYGLPDSDIKRLHTHTYYLVPAPSVLEQVAQRELESERDIDHT